MNDISSLHRTGCDVWAMERSEGPSKLHPAADGEVATERYLARIAPAYDVLGRILAQLSGVFLLALTHRTERLALDHGVYRVALDQLAEARDLIGPIVAPEPARRHREALGRMAALLAEAAELMDSPSRPECELETYRRGVLRRLDAAQKLLIATAAPDAGITPVDFENACCNCGMPHSTH